MRNKNKPRLANKNKRFEVLHTGRLLTSKNNIPKRIKWTISYKEVKHTNRIVEDFLNRSFTAVIGSYLYRKNNKINTRNIYSYKGDEEAHRLLNRSVCETLKESCKFKRQQT